MNNNYLNKVISIKNNTEKYVSRDEIFKRISEGAYISFAQNNEDVILERIFTGKNSGFYIDVGCYHPVIKSTTCHFHLKGWSGINIDVSEKNIKNFNSYRPNDINLNSLIGANNEMVDVYILEGTTRSTKTQELGLSYIERGKDVQKTRKEQKSLNSILEEFKEIPKIDFLSIDVEGAELDVLKGINFKKFRPKVVLAEATYPETNIPNCDDWEPLLLEAGYELVYLDGLNRFYMDNPTIEEKDNLKLPPNYFDNFIKFELIDAI